MHTDTHYPVTCDKCREFKKLIARVFPSEAHLKDKKYMASLGLTYLGGDKFSGDPLTDIAVWPGKNNANLKFSEYTFCCPVHPNCGHEYYEISLEEIEDEPDDEISEIFREGRARDANRRLVTDQQYKENVEANEERIRLERKYGPITKSGVIFSVGVWEEPTCCQEPEESSEEWLTNYIQWKIQTI
ncbi:hypothetical protein [Leptospira sanjuanensis]|uniref:hypothetical protein n=1 Tax=Leptospira sanjuanensis TaxID=2879643 RepID=UPI001EE96115|nr:hypothetical protein [Leptospira sanjuanensis]MCG6170250.1 hypothetical protein [Leptospira sanjuanensis]